MIPSVLLHEAVEHALREDLHAGDITSEAVVSEDTAAIARAIAKAPLVACGSQVFAHVFYSVDPGLRVEELIRDGSSVDPGSVLYEVEGSARSILAAERTALNFVQRMSGIATLTRSFVQELPENSGTRITDTRKTTPGLRAFERYAVRVGGAHNHRDSLGSGIMIKDNHIRAAGSITAAVAAAERHAPHTHRIEVEVDSNDGLDEALAAGATLIMLDNFDDAAVEQALERNRGRALIEVSGGLTRQRVRKLAELGVDILSVGALTHSAPAADISLELEVYGS